MVLRTRLCALVMIVGSMGGFCPSRAAEPLPAAWQEHWNQPAAEDRPLQIAHHLAHSPGSAEEVNAFAHLGLGGVVFNVDFDQHYLRSEEKWQAFAAAVARCQELGLKVWIYDEKGYPSGAAGGLVLEGHPEYEATALAFDASRTDPFVVRPSYEHTHASNRYAASQRYPNLIDDRAMRRFLELTHDAYAQHVGQYFGETVVATFTDEPSLMAVNIGQLGEEVRKTIPVIDPLDPSVQPLPSVPWCYDLPERYQQRYGEDLMAARRSLFEGDNEADRRTRRQFWALVTELIDERYFGAIQQWCHAHRLASSGHTLWEEDILHHVALEGDGLQALARMDIPGLDMLSSDPTAVIHSGWMTAAMPSSAAVLNGGRRVMTEVSDFSQKMGKQGPAALPEMQATAAWQAAWGVTEFSVYYSSKDRPEETTRAYGDYVGRLNALLRPARRDAAVLLYYPVWDLWAEYRPVAEPLTPKTQSPRAQQILNSFNALGQRLERSQIPFVLVDHPFLAGATVQPDGKLQIHEHCFSTLVLPDGVELPPEAAATVERFRQADGRVISDSPAIGSQDSLRAAIQPAYRLEPSRDDLVLGQFIRDGRSILLVVNVGTTDYQGELTGSARSWLVADPATGTITPQAAPAGTLPIHLAPRQALVLVP